jgi:sugar/nucleoside kinase (ribokinase family)
MSQPSTGPVVCFSYLAAAALWKVPHFPLANHGAEVLEVEHSIAADGPMAAAVLSALDVPTLLLSNELGEDSYGNQVHAWLQRHQVATASETVPDVATPQIVIVADDDQTRTWFPYLPGVVDSLARIDLSPLEQASFVYLDCYQLIEAPAVRVIEAARTVGLPLLLNLGGSDLSPAVVAAVRDYPGLVMQTNVNDDAHSTAADVATSMREQINAAWSVVTAGAFGAVAVSQSETVTAPGFHAVVRHTHCAGAAFSGGLLYGLRSGRSMLDSLLLGSASGALRCERAHSASMPTLEELEAVISSRKRTTEM